MDLEFVRDRITELRIEKGISEYRMSLDLGHSKNYIQNISSGKCAPSLSELFYICEYFRITPAEFFQEEDPDSLNVIELHRLARKLSDENLRLLLSMAKTCEQVEKIREQPSKTE